MKYEYKIITGSVADMERKMNELGKDGWRVVSVDYGDRTYSALMENAKFDMTILDDHDDEFLNTVV